MKYIKSILFVALAISLCTSCKKDKYEGPQGPAGPTGPTGISTNPNPAMYAKWDVVSGLSGTRYVILKSDNSIHLLDSAQYGFKALESDLAFITSNQITIFLEIFNYSVANDTLRLTNTNKNVVLKKNNNAPDETEWVTFVTITNTIPNPEINGDGRQDIGFDGTNILWAGDWNSSTIYKINPTSATSTALSLMGSYYSPSINYAPSAIWIVNSNTIDEVNATTGAVMSSSPVLSANRIQSLALIGQKMFYSADGYIYTWDIITDEILQHFPLDVYGMEYVGGYMYFMKNHLLYKCQVSPFQCVLTYYIDSPVASGNSCGVTYDGSNFWIVGEDPATSEYVLAKLSI